MTALDDHNKERLPNSLCTVHASSKKGSTVHFPSCPIWSTQQREPQPITRYWSKWECCLSYCQRSPRSHIKKVLYRSSDSLPSQISHGAVSSQLSISSLLCSQLPPKLPAPWLWQDILYQDISRVQWAKNWWLPEISMGAVAALSCLLVQDRRSKDAHYASLEDLKLILVQPLSCLSLCISRHCQLVHLG